MVSVLWILIASASLVSIQCSPVEEAVQINGDVVTDAAAVPPKCTAWIFLHPFKTGGTTLRNLLAFQWAHVRSDDWKIVPEEDRTVIGGHYTPRDFDDWDMKHFNPDRSRFRTWCGPKCEKKRQKDFLFRGDEEVKVQSLKELVEDRNRNAHLYPGNETRVYVEVHSAEPTQLDPKQWWTSEFCNTTCSCLLTVALREPAEYYASIFRADGADRIVKTCGRRREVLLAFRGKGANELDPHKFIPTWPENPTLDDWAELLTIYWDAAKDKRGFLTCFRDALSREIESHCFDAARGIFGVAAQECLMTDTVLDERTALFNVYGRTEYLDEMYDAIAGLLNFTGTKPRPEHLPHQANTLNLAPHTRAVQHISDIMVGEAVKDSEIDKALMETIFPNDVRVRVFSELQASWFSDGRLLQTKPFGKHTTDPFDFVDDELIKRQQVAAPLKEPTASVSAAEEHTPAQAEEEPASDLHTSGTEHHSEPTSAPTLPTTDTSAKEDAPSRPASFEQTIDAQAEQIKELAERLEKLEIAFDQAVKSWS